MVSAVSPAIVMRTDKLFRIGLVNHCDRVVTRPDRLTSRLESTDSIAPHLDSVGLHHSARIGMINQTDESSWLNRNITGAT